MQVREGEAPSYFNARRRPRVAELASGVLQQAGAAGWLQPNDLGVIATYRKQARVVLKQAVYHACRSRILHCYAVHACHEVCQAKAVLPSTAARCPAGAWLRHVM